MQQQSCSAQALTLLAWLQNKNTEYCAPLTSFDWNETDPKRLGTASIDTTCTIWDIEVGCQSLRICLAQRAQH